MIDEGKRDVFGVAMSVVDYEAAVDRLLNAAVARQPFAASAIAVHPLVTAVREPSYRYCLNRLDLVAPDGQPVRWALNLLHGVGLRERVYGPSLMWHLLLAAESARIPVYLYGSRQSILSALRARLRREIPALTVAGTQPGQYRPARPGEPDEIANRIRASGAQLVLVGLGAPRQEIFAYTLREKLSMPLLAVGAAFDYHAGFLRQPPSWMQRRGLEWVWRLGLEPRRLWRRYLSSNPAFVALLISRLLHVSNPRQLAAERAPTSPVDV